MLEQAFIDHQQAAHLTVSSARQFLSDFADRESPIPHAVFANAKLGAMRGLLQERCPNLNGELPAALVESPELINISIDKDSHDLLQRMFPTLRDGISQNDLSQLVLQSPQLHKRDC